MATDSLFLVSWINHPLCLPTPLFVCTKNHFHAITVAIPASSADPISISSLATFSLCFPNYVAKIV
eukprot:bmy_09287T0